jgi:tellurite resistance protein
MSIVPSMPHLSTVATAFREAATKIRVATREIVRSEDPASTWVQRFIYREIEGRAGVRGAAYWDAVFPGLPPEQRAERRICRMLTRATVAGVAAAAGATTAEVLSLATEGVGALLAIPLGVASVGAELLYTTALQIDLAFDLASIYGVPFAQDDVGEISTLLAMGLGVQLIREPTRHDKPGTAGEQTKPWRVMRQMQRSDFATQVGRELLQQSVLRNAVPVVGVVVSAAWNQIVLRRFARHVHAAAQRRAAIVHACRGVQQPLDPRTARTVLDGAWFLATTDAELGHEEALALATLIDSLGLPGSTPANEASFPDDDEEWFARVASIDPGAHGVLLEVLALMAGVDGELSTPERRFLRRVGHVLGREVDFRALERTVARFRLVRAPKPADAPESLDPLDAGLPAPSAG